METGRLAIKQK